MKSTIKFGIMSIILLVLASTVMAAWPSDLTFTTNVASATVENPFVARLQISPSGGPMDPFNGYDNVTIALPGELSATQSLFQDISSYGSDTFTWNMNSTAAGSYTINVSVNGTQFTSNANITINPAVALPQLTITMPDIADNQVVGESITVSVQFDNTGGDATDINGFLNAQGASLNQSTFSISSILNGASTTVDFELTPSSFGNLSLFANYSNYKKSDSTLVSAGDAEFDGTGDTDYYYTVASPVVSLPSSVEITSSSPSNSIDLDDYVSDADTAKVDLSWVCNSTNSNLFITVDSSNVLNISTVSSSEFSASVDCFATDGVATGTDSLSVSANPVAPAPTPAPQPTSSGSGGSLPTTASKSFAWSQLSAGDVKTFIVTDNVIAITEVEFKVLNDLKDAAIKVKEIESLPNLMNKPEFVYQILFFEKTNLPDEDLDSATIKFEVEKSWLSTEDLNEDSIVLMRYHDDEWQELETKILSSDAVNVYYSAETPGFSYFVVSAKSEIEELVEDKSEDVIEETEEISEEVEELGGSVEEIEDIISGEETQEEITEDKVNLGWTRYLLAAFIAIAFLSLIVLVVLKLILVEDEKPIKVKKQKKESKLWGKIVDYFMEEDTAPVKKTPKKRK